MSLSHANVQKATDYLFASEQEWLHAKKFLHILKIQKRVFSGMKLDCKKFQVLKHSFMYFCDDQGHELLVCLARHYHLGFGSFGKVKMAEDERSMPYALKITFLPLNPNELAVLKKLGYLVFAGTNTTASGDPRVKRRKYFILQKYIKGINFKDYIDLVKLDENQKLTLAHRLVQAVKNLHEINSAAAEKKEEDNERIIHGDIKPDNFIFDPDDNTIKAIDFTGSHILNRDEKEYLGETVCALDFRAPEANEPKAKLSIQSDIYSLGVIFDKFLQMTNPIVSQMQAAKPEDRPSLDVLLDALQPKIPVELPKPDMKKQLIMRYQRALALLKNYVKNFMKKEKQEFKSDSFYGLLVEARKLKNFDFKKIKDELIETIRIVVKRTNDIEELHAFFAYLKKEEMKFPILRYERHYPGEAGATDSWKEAVDIFKVRCMELAKEKLNLKKPINNPQLYRNIFEEQRARIFKKTPKRLGEFEELLVQNRV